jgi:hypothetical protein
MALTSKWPQLFYEDRGSGEPVLVINGFALSSAVLDPLVDPRWCWPAACSLAATTRKRRLPMREARVRL